MGVIFELSLGVSFGDTVHGHSKMSRLSLFCEFNCMLSLLCLMLRDGHRRDRIIVLQADLRLSRLNRVLRESDLGHVSFLMNLVLRICLCNLVFGHRERSNVGIVLQLSLTMGLGDARVVDRPEGR